MHAAGTNVPVPSACRAVPVSVPVVNSLVTPNQVQQSKVLFSQQRGCLNHKPNPGFVV